MVADRRGPTFELRPSYEQLTTPIDESHDLRTWREIAQLALAKLAVVSEENVKLRAALRDAIREAVR